MTARVRIGERQDSSRPEGLGHSPDSRRRPPYWREVAVTAPAVFSLILVVGTIGAPVLSQLPELAATALTVVAVVMLLTWPVMPALSRLLGDFLRPPVEPEP